MSDRDPTRDPRERTEDPAERIERVLDEVAAEGGYPANTDDLAAQYRATEFDLANETETFADAFDRLADEYEAFDDPEAAREALTAQLRRDERFDDAFTNER
ncbi:hypothetical protein [Halosegnis marinus]|uniref:Uncharacterized protein n=1 Tax=Halosegnis marinus TaxID=3034023 RepID=A0ABD5ZNS3_9EURY|nr:hypothetical protein [Halosegnis sp. DT85]